MFNSAMNALLFIESTTRPIAAYELKLTNQINDFVYDKYGIVCGNIALVNR